MKLAKIDANTPDPPGGTIDRYPDGTPTGVLKELAQGLVTDLIPGADRGAGPERHRAHREGIPQRRNDRPQGSGNRRSRVGGVSESARAPEPSRCESSFSGERGKPSKRPRRSPRASGSFTKPYRTTGDSHLISGGIKMMIDGSGGARTAWLHEPWNKEYTRRRRGQLRLSGDSSRSAAKQIRMFHDAGHARERPLHRRSRHRLGGRFLRHGVRGEPSEGSPSRHHPRQHPDRPRDRHHGEAPGRVRRRLSGALGPFHVVDRRHLRRQLRSRAREATQPVQDVRRQEHSLGGRVGFRSDALPRALRHLGLGRAEAGPGVYDKDPYGRDEAVDVRTALRSYTIWSAHQLFLENEIGSLEPGKYADIAVWDKNLYEIPTEELETHRVPDDPVPGRRRVRKIVRSPRAVSGAPAFISLPQRHFTQIGPIRSPSIAERRTAISCLSTS